MSARSRGYSLLEVMIAVAVVGVVSAVAFPRLDELSRRSHFNGATRRLVGTLRESRAMAIARQDVAGVRAEQVGIRVDSPTQYTQFMDPDTDSANDNDVVLRVVNVLTIDRAQGFRIVSPPGTVIRFRRDGSTTATTLDLADDYSVQTRTIRLTAGGQTSIN